MMLVLHEAPPGGITAVAFRNHQVQVDRRGEAVVRRIHRAQACTQIARDLQRSHIYKWGRERAR